MKVYIGKYTNWFGPYQLAEMICFWEKRDKPNTRGDYSFKLGQFFDRGFSDDPTHETWLCRLLNWINRKKKRRVKIRIDGYDVWNMDSTLAMIILPMLKKIRENKDGFPYVNDEYVPEELRSTNAKPFDPDNEWDELAEARWKWIIDELVWTFEQIHPDSESEEAFYDSTDKLYDREAYLKHHQRIRDGLVLFGRFYQNLWT